METKTISQLRLLNAEPNPQSRIAVASVPIPKQGKVPTGFAGIPSQSVDVAWWPDSMSGRKRAPRRRLMFAVTDGYLPNQFELGRPSRPSKHLRQVKVTKRVVNENLATWLPYQTSELKFQWKNRSLGIRVGIRWKNELHWWQWLRVEEVWSGPLVKAVRAGGFIEVDPATEKEFKTKRGFFGSTRLHRHDWLFGEVFALCFANGVVQVTVRHVNNHRFDEGRHLKGLVPVVAFAPDQSAKIDESLQGWNTKFQIGSASLNLDDASPLVSAEHPGRLRSEKDLVIYQPYEGVEVEGGTFRGGRKDRYRVRAREKAFPKGVARSVRFHFSLGDAAPVVSRLTVPEWWYALCRELWPDDVLPVRDEFDARIDRTYEINNVDKRGRFDEAIMGRAWEGESPYAALLYFYRTGQIEHWRRAIRDAYHIADIAFDHSTETIRMTDYPFDGSIAPPLFRTVGLTFGYLETGDPYLLDCAESAASHWYWIDRHNWPRYAYGRDAGSLRSLVFLWDYTGKEDYLTMAREAIGRVIQCQNPDGSYFDQGGTIGIHAIGQVVRKPWMANLATDALVDYLLRRPGDETLWQSVEKAGGYMMRSFVRGKNKDYWPYQLSYGGTKYDPWIHQRSPESRGKLPTKWPMAHGHKARLLNLMTRRTGRAEFYETWLRFFRKHWAVKEPPKGDYHMFNKTLQHLPYAQSHTWNARWQNGTLWLDPVRLSGKTELQGTIVTPVGKVSLKIRQSGRKWKLLEQEGSEVPVRFEEHH